MVLCRDSFPQGGDGTTTEAVPEPLVTQTTGELQQGGGRESISDPAGHSTGEPLPMDISLEMEELAEEEVSSREKESADATGQDSEVVAPTTDDGDTKGDVGDTNEGSAPTDSSEAKQQNVSTATPMTVDAKPENSTATPPSLPQTKVTGSPCEIANTPEGSDKAKVATVQTDASTSIETSEAVAGKKKIGDAVPLTEITNEVKIQGAPAEASTQEGDGVREEVLPLGKNRTSSEEEPEASQGKPCLEGGKETTSGEHGDFLAIPSGSDGIDAEECGEEQEERQLKQGGSLEEEERAKGEEKEENEEEGEEEVEGEGEDEKEEDEEKGGMGALHKVEANQLSEAEELTSNSDLDSDSEEDDMSSSTGHIVQSGVRVSQDLSMLTLTTEFTEEDLHCQTVTTLSETEPNSKSRDTKEDSKDESGMDIDTHGDGSGGSEEPDCPSPFDQISSGVSSGQQTRKTLYSGVPLRQGNRNVSYTTPSRVRKGAKRESLKGSTKGKGKRPITPTGFCLPSASSISDLLRKLPVPSPPKAKPKNTRALPNRESTRPPGSHIYKVGATDLNLAMHTGDPDAPKVFVCGDFQPEGSPCDYPPAATSKEAETPLEGYPPAMTSKEAATPPEHGRVKSKRSKQISEHKTRRGFIGKKGATAQLKSAGVRGGPAYTETVATSQFALQPAPEVILPPDLDYFSDIVSLKKPKSIRRRSKSKFKHDFGYPTVHPIDRSMQADFTPLVYDLLPECNKGLSPGSLGQSRPKSTPKQSPKPCTTRKKKGKASSARDQKSKYDKTLLQLQEPKTQSAPHSSEKSQSLEKGPKLGMKRRVSFSTEHGGAAVDELPTPPQPKKRKTSRTDRTAVAETAGLTPPSGQLYEEDISEQGGSGKGRGKRKKGKGNSMVCIA